ncbi:AB hydrolase-1 domain-containing protein [Mycena venus]|uniref:AB hydrolase-1 domain-containing protein n=1 Tax=Mycena venus TaxID=2733690 RepID=A0A8H7CLE7_9AGAR|nr:AB hydrolase-1 domain-containing protein [Mycena venus]
MTSSSFLKLAAAGLLISNVLAADFDWETLTATASLNWTSCYSGFECSLLEVPLDYTGADKRNASIAVLRLPATAPKEQYRGPILFNPGGPGGSGVSTIVSIGAEFAEVFGTQFDIVGFDPRGVSFSKPSVSFFNTAAERQNWIPSDLDSRYPSLNATSEVISRNWAQFQLIGQIAEERDTMDFLQYITTDNVARDMLQISRAFGYEKLQYYGVSYGSLLGATFATLFPDNVGRIAIDGIMDWEAWYSSDLTGSLMDTDKTLQTFFDGCVSAGPSACAFYAPTASQIASNLASLADSIRAQPFPRPHLPLARHGRLQLLSQLHLRLSEGNATGVYTANQTPDFECDCTSDAAPFTANIFESQIATACGDGPVVNDSITELREFYTNQAKVSSFADIWGHWRIHCDGWRVHREGRFQGPAGGNTSFPLLVIGNTADPVTPLAWAKKAAGLFPDSVVLTQDSPGHMSLVAPSLCTHGALRTYFQNGTLPAPGTVCAVDAELFPGAANTTATAKARTLIASSDSDNKLLDAVRAIGEVVRPIAAMGRALL